MKTRREFLIVGGAGLCVFATPLAAQQPGKVLRIGYLDFGSRQLMIDVGRYAALMEGMRERGYLEGRDFVLEARFANGDAARLNAFAEELARQKVDLILSTGTPASHAAQRATSTIPIVVTTANDPVGDGFAASLARPGGNMTGLSGGAADAVQKLAEMLIVAVPKLKRIAVLVNPANDSHPPMVLNLQVTARKAGRQVLPMGVRTPGEIERRFATMAPERIDAVIILGDTFLFSQRAQIAGLALKHRLPSIYTVAGYAEAGGLMSYGQDTNNNFHRAGIFVDKILKGARPGDIPFEEPTRYYFVINRKTANALGVRFTNELLARADKVIE